MSTTTLKTGRAQGLVPLLLFASSAVVWAALAIQKVRGFSGALFVCATTLCLAYAVWLVAELKVAAKEGTQGQTQRDGGSLPLYAVGRIATVTAALALPSWRAELSVPALLGLALFVFGVGLRLYAIHTLGQYYSHYVRKLAQHRIVDSGPYRYVRHPAYTGMLVAHLGFVSFFFNPVAAVVFAGIFVPAVVFRILVEERSLFEIEGYAEFAQGRARLLPFVW